MTTLVRASLGIFFAHCSLRARRAISSKLLLFAPFPQFSAVFLTQKLFHLLYRHTGHDDETIENIHEQKRDEIRETKTLPIDRRRVPYSSSSSSSSSKSRCSIFIRACIICICLASTPISSSKSLRTLSRTARSTDLSTLLANEDDGIGSNVDGAERVDADRFTKDVN